MTNDKTEEKPPTIQDAMNDCLIQMQSYDATADEYYKIIQSLSALHELHTSDKKAKKFNISPDALLAVFGNLAGISLILSYEKLNIITSKAFGLILKSKL